MNLYEDIARRLLFRLDPWRAHRLAMFAGARLSRSPMARRMLRGVYRVPCNALRIEVFGLTFPKPVGLAAGFDKGGSIHPVFADLGFGHVEIGSVSLRPWPGNPPPVYLRLPLDRGLINRLGLNSEGVQVVLGRLRQARYDIPTGLNLVKTADPGISGEEAVRDFVECFRSGHPHADFVTLNLSCPNTAEGLTFEDPAALATLLQQLQLIRSEIAGAGKPKPVLLKISPDLDEPALHAILDLAAEFEIDGLVIANTTRRRENLRTSVEILDRFGFGGLSGYPLGHRSREMLARVRAYSGRRFTLVACGGIGCDPRKSPAEEVWEYLQLGATLVQLHTGLIYRGPGIARAINTGLLKILKEKGIPSLKDSITRRDEYRG
jgi:dihydroorotate dehydrogenase